MRGQCRSCYSCRQEKFSMFEGISRAKKPYVRVWIRPSSYNKISWGIQGELRRNILFNLDTSSVHPWELLNSPWEHHAYSVRFTEMLLDS